MRQHLNKEGLNWLLWTNPVGGLQQFGTCQRTAAVRNLPVYLYWREAWTFCFVVSRTVRHSRVATIVRLLRDCVWAATFRDTNLSECTSSSGSATEANRTSGCWLSASNNLETSKKKRHLPFWTEKILRQMSVFTGRWYVSVVARGVSSSTWYVSVETYTKCQQFFLFHFFIK